MPTVTLNSLDGSKIDAYVALPKNGATGPALIVLHEIFGITKQMKELCDHYAAKGCVVICPNLFWREVTIDQVSSTEPDWEQASKLYNNFSVEAGLRDVFAALAQARQMKECGGRVGVLGVCLGARLAYLMATRADIDCAVTYYGVGIDSYLDEVHDIRSPFMLHIAEQDKLIPDDVRKKLVRNMSRNDKVQTHLYVGVEHGFARVGDPKYIEASAKEADQRTVAFLEENLF